MNSSGIVCIVHKVTPDEELMGKGKTTQLCRSAVKF